MTTKRTASVDTMFAQATTVHAELVDTKSHKIPVNMTRERVEIKTRDLDNALEEVKAILSTKPKGWKHYGFKFDA